jgi:hypothetical protein
MTSCSDAVGSHSPVSVRGFSVSFMCTHDTSSYLMYCYEGKRDTIKCVAIIAIDRKDVALGVLN